MNQLDICMRSLKTEMKICKTQYRINNKSGGSDKAFLEYKEERKKFFFFKVSRWKKVPKPFTLHADGRRPDTTHTQRNIWATDLFINSGSDKIREFVENWPDVNLWLIEFHIRQKELEEKRIKENGGIDFNKKGITYL